MTRGVNLIPEEIQHAWRMGRIRTVLTVVALIYLAGLGVVFFGQRKAISRQKASLKQLEAQKQTLLGSSAEFAQLQGSFKEAQQTEGDLKKRLDAVTGLAQKRISWSTMLKWLSHNTPGGIWLKSVSTSDDQATQAKKVRLLGTSMSNGAVADFMFTIENSGFFQDATLAYTQKRDIGKTPVYDFEISAALKKTSEMMYEW